MAFNVIGSPRLRLNWATIFPLAAGVAAFGIGFAALRLNREAARTERVFVQGPDRVVVKAASDAVFTASARLEGMVTLSLVNDTSETVVVAEVGKNCSCVDATVEPKLIPAGGTATMVLTTRSVGQFGNTIHGQVMVEGARRHVCPFSIDMIPDLPVPRILTPNPFELGIRRESASSVVELVTVEATSAPWLSQLAPDARLGIPAVPLRVSSDREVGPGLRERRYQGSFRWRTPPGPFAVESDVRDATGASVGKLGMRGRTDPDLQLVPQALELSIRKDDPRPFVERRVALSVAQEFGKLAHSEWRSLPPFVTAVREVRAANEAPVWRLHIDWRRASTHRLTLVVRNEHGVEQDVGLEMRVHVE